MTITREEVHDIAVDAVSVVRGEIEKELGDIRLKMAHNAWSEQRAREVATIAAEIAVKQITDQFYMSVGKKTVAAIGATVVVSVVMFRDYLKDLIGMK